MRLSWHTASPTLRETTERDKDWIGLSWMNYPHDKALYIGCNHLGLPSYQTWAPIQLPSQLKYVDLKRSHWWINLHSSVTQATEFQFLNRKGHSPVSRALELSWIHTSLKGERMPCIGTANPTSIKPASTSGLLASTGLSATVRENSLICERSAGQKKSSEL